MEKFARFMRNTGPARFFVPLGVILIVFGIILSGFHTDSYVETTGKIMSVTEAAFEEDGEQQFDVNVSYLVDGKPYQTTFSNLSGDYAVGQEIPVFYDPANPTSTTNGRISGVVPPVMIVLGIAALVFGVYKTVAAFHKSKQLDAAVGSFPHEAFDGYKTAPGVTEYYFRFDGNSLKPGYVIENASRALLFEGKMQKQALVGARTYEFVNHVCGKTSTHEVGHTVTQTVNDSFFSAKSSFKFDGKNIWDVLHERGIRISTNLLSKFPNSIYDVAQNGAAFAKIETCGKYVHEEDAAEHKINLPVGNMYYRFWTSSEDFETLFLTIFALSETEQAVVE